jgi:demethylmenaquinone methyltransferase/2-methoxy-6-polyprenyl-1,4-benzoquinol methylase
MSAIVQEGIQRVFDEAADYYKHLRWEKNRLTRLEHALTYRVLEEELGRERIAHAVELGCGPGTWTALLAQRAATVTAVDLSARMLDQARRAITAPNVAFVQHDVTTFEPDQQQDRVVSVRVLEYVPGWRQVIAGMGRWVAPGGRAVVITKTPLSVWRGTGRDRWFVAGPRRLVRRIVKGPRRRDFWQRYLPVRALCAAFAAAGFENVSVRPVIFGLPIYMRGTKQYPLVPPFLEPPLLHATERTWTWISRRGEAARRTSLFFSESYAVTAWRSLA